MPSSSLVPMSEVAKHNTVEDCWLLIKDKVYNLSNFIHEHPGGVDIIAACQQQPQHSRHQHACCSTGH